MIMMCPCRFLHCNTRATLVGDVREAMHVGGQGLCGKSLYLPHNCYEPKTALKHEIFLKKIILKKTRGHPILVLKVDMGGGGFPIRLN